MRKRAIRGFDINTLHVLAGLKKLRIRMIFSVERYSFSFSIVESFFYSCCFALLTAYAAQVYISFPWTPVPITLQTFVVLLSGIVLKKWWGSLSQVLYVIGGIAGIPFFYKMQHGIDIIVGPRGGYIIGFILTSFLVGHVFEKINDNSFWYLCFWITSIYFIFIYGLGCLWLGGWMYFIKGVRLSINELLWLGFFPFIIGDFLKILCVISYKRLRG